MVKFEADRDRYGAKFKVEIHAVELLKNSTPPVLASEVQANTLTRKNSVHISVTTEQEVSTYVWNNQQQLIQTATAKEFEVPLFEGTNNFVLQAVDALGNKSEIMYLSNITLDTTPPNINAVLASEYIYSTYPQTFTITFNSDEDLQALTVNNISAMMISPKVFTYLITVDQPSTLNLSIKAFDIAGNEAIRSFDPIFSIENTPPVISSSLPNNSFTNQSSFNILITDNSETETFVYLNGSLALTDSSKSFSMTLSEGLNHFLIKSKDKYNNEALDLELFITYDVTPPALTHNILPTYYLKVVPGEIVIEFRSNEPLQRFETGGGGVIIPVNSVYRFKKQIPQAGNHSVNIKATDLAGNLTNFSLSFVVVFDNIAPSITFGAVPVSTDLTSVPIVVTVVDSNDVLTTIKVNGVTQSNTTQKTFTFSSYMPTDGIYLFSFRASDGAGNVTTAEFSIVKESDSTAPIISLMGAQDANFTSENSFQFQVSIADQSSVTNAATQPLAAWQ